MVGPELLASEYRELQVLGDTAYGTGQARADLAAAGHTAIIKPGPLQPAVEGGFTIDDFTVNEQAGTVTCPNGVTRCITAPPQGHLRRRLPGLPAARAMHGQGQGPRHEPARSGRDLAAGPPGLGSAGGSPRRLPAAPAHGRALHRLADRPQNRCRQLRYRGISKNDQWLHLRMAGLNLRRMINLGLRATAGGWTISRPA